MDLRFHSGKLHRDHAHRVYSRLAEENRGSPGGREAAIPAHPTYARRPHGFIPDVPARPDDTDGYRQRQPPSPSWNCGLRARGRVCRGGFILVPTMYHYVWNAARYAPHETQVKMQKLVLRRDNILLAQLRVGLLFPLFLLIGVRARGRNAGLHKRMMILATAIALGASIDRIRWLPTTLPASILSSDLYILLAVSPMFIWDIVRNRTIHPAYGIWLSVYLLFSLVVYGLWDTAWWHSMAPRLMGV